MTLQHQLQATMTRCNLQTEEQVFFQDPSGTSEQGNVTQGEVGTNARDVATLLAVGGTNPFLQSQPLCWHYSFISPWW